MNSRSPWTRLTTSLVLVLAAAGPVLAQQDGAVEPPTPSAVASQLANPPPPEPKHAPPPQGPSVSSPPSRPVSERAFAKNLLIDQKTIWTAPLHSENYHVRFVLPFALVTAGLIASDKAAARELSEGPPGNGVDVSRGLSYTGSAAAVYSFAGAFYGLARLTHNDRARETGLLALEALVNSTIVVELLKTATQRQRPTRDNGRQRINDARGKFESGGSSFPSGHAINAWSLASVMAARYPDRPLIKYGAYAIAATASISRLTARKHFPSDTLVGAVLGYLIGHYVVRAHAQPGPKRGPVRPMIFPYLDGARQQYGVSLHIQF